MGKTYLLVGLTGSGKSTTGNCILNKSGEFDKLNNYPFKASDSASGVTACFQKAQDSNGVIVLDSIGFGDPQFDQKFVLSELKKALAYVDYKIDCVLFVLKADKFRQETVEFFDCVQESVFQHKCNKNSVLIVTNCKKGWCARQTNLFFKNVLEKCNNTYFEFSLKFSQDYEDQDKNGLKEVRQLAIDSLVKFLDCKLYEKIDLSHMQSDIFDVKWINVIMPVLLQIMGRYFGGPVAGILSDNSSFITNTALNLANDNCKTM